MDDKNNRTRDQGDICSEHQCDNSSDSLEYEGFLSTNIDMIFTICGVISLISLFIVFIVYSVIPDFHSLHGKIVLSNVVSAGLVSSFLLIVFNVKEYVLYLCECIGYFGYFSSMSMFSWMTIMCYDLSSTLLQNTVQRNTSHGTRFLVYSVCGWGLAFILTTTLLVQEQLLPPDSDFNPDIGNQTCFISPEGNKFLYLFHLPILIMMMVNIYFFTTIIATLSKSHRQTRSMRMFRR